MNLNVKNLGQVWTPEWLTTLVLDKAGYYGSDILTKTILEPSFGAGVFIKEIVKRLISEGLKQKYTPKELTKIIDESVYGIEYDEKCFNATKSELINWVEQTYGINVKLPNLHKMDALDYNNFSFFDYVVGNPLMLEFTIFLTI